MEEVGALAVEVVSCVSGPEQVAAVMGFDDVPNEAALEVEGDEQSAT